MEKIKMIIGDLKYQKDRERKRQEIAMQEHIKKQIALAMSKLNQTEEGRWLLKKIQEDNNNFLKKQTEYFEETNKLTETSKELKENFDNTKNQKEQLESEHSKLQQEFSTLKEENQKVIEVNQKFSDANKRWSEEYLELENKLTETQNQLQKALKFEEKFKKHLIKNHLQDRQNLYEKTFEIIWDLYILNKQQKQKPEKKEESQQEQILNYEKYFESIKCVCEKEKSQNSKGCNQCRSLADSLRKKPEIASMEMAWKEVWKSYGITMEEGMEKPMENA